MILSVKLIMPGKRVVYCQMAAEEYLLLLFPNEKQKEKACTGAEKTSTAMTGNSHTAHLAFLFIAPPCYMS